MSKCARYVNEHTRYILDNVNRLFYSLSALGSHLQVWWECWIFVLMLSVVEANNMLLSTRLWGQALILGPWWQDPWGPHFSSWGFFSPWESQKCKIFRYPDTFWTCNEVHAQSLSLQRTCRSITPHINLPKGNETCFNLAKHWQFIKQYSTRISSCVRLSHRTATGLFHTPYVYININVRLELLENVCLLIMGWTTV